MNVTYEAGKRGESRPVVDHTGDPLTPPALTATELAAHLGVTPDTVRIKAKTREIPGMRVGRLWRFDLAAVLAALTPSSDPWAQSPASARARRKR